jgi:ribonuclease BN (tRNA processing enzyme)
MQLLFLGSGSAHTLAGDNFQSNMILTADNGRRLLIDCGSDIRWSLARRGLSYKAITDIYISHLHADHIGGLEHIGFQTKFDPGCVRPRLYLDASLPEPLWNNSLKGGMGLIADGETTLETYFEVHEIANSASFEFEGIRLQPIPTTHVTSPRRTIFSHGLFIEHRQRKTFITTDTQFCPDHLTPYYAAADLIFHDCEIGQAKTGVHSHYDDLVSLPQTVRAKTWLYDYQPTGLPDVVSDGFRGLVTAGQSFEL